ncbi:hypothetical protein LUTEI9C_10319 [Luteimonas sp. 9C]|nr:hypothetical protein LUTEI9C_10319 [Luteimonas sp. 9C]
MVTPSRRASGSTATACTPVSAIRSSAACAQSSALRRLGRSVGEASPDWAVTADFGAGLLIATVYPYASIRNSIDAPDTGRLAALTAPETVTILVRTVSIGIPPVQPAPCRSRFP